MKYESPKNHTRTEICLIQSASNNYVGLNPLVSFYCPSITIFVTILVRFCCLLYFYIITPSNVQVLVVVQSA